jgi:hypothetical protein
MRDLTPDDGCAPVRDAQPDLLHGRLAGGARARAERHVAGCAACADELALLAARARPSWPDSAGHRPGAITAPSTHAAQTAPDRSPARPRADPAVAWPRRNVRSSAPGTGGGGRGGAARSRPSLAALGLAGRRGWGGLHAYGRRSGAGRGGVPAPHPRCAPTGVPLDPAPPAPAARASAPPSVLASAEPSLGARFDDLTDDELQAVIAAVEGADGALLSEEPAAEEPPTGEGG